MNRFPATNRLLQILYRNFAGGGTNRKQYQASASDLRRERGIIHFVVKALFSRS
jgi:hypothetical protein